MKKLLHFKYLRLFYITFLVSLVSAINSFGQILTVSTTGVDTGNCQGIPCLTIQYAINQASAGNTINVGAGTFAGFNINKALIINGINLNITPNEATTTRAVILGTVFSNPVAVPETIINSTISVVSNNVTINGFEIVNANVTCNSSNFSFLFNKLNSSTEAAALDQISPTTVTNWQVKDNRVGHSTIVMTGFGFRLPFINNLVVERNQIWRARSGGIVLNNVTNVTISRNVINEGTVNSLTETILELQYKGSPIPPTPLDPSYVAEFGIEVGNNCNNVQIIENEIVSLEDSDTNTTNDAPIKVFASGLTGKLLIQGNILVGVNVILIPDAFSSYSNNFIQIVENQLSGNIETGNGIPTGTINANCNCWSNAFEPNANLYVVNTGGTIGATKVERITFIYASTDISITTTGFQTNRVVTYDDIFTDANGVFTLQRAINSTARDHLFRWTLEPGFTNTTIPVSNVQINKPMILKGNLNSGPTQVNITPNATPATQLFAITSDSVTVKNFNMTVNNTIPTAILVKGNRQQLIENVTFNSLATTDFSYIKIDNDKAAGAPPMSATLLNNTFKSPATLNGSAVFFSNTSKTVSTPDVNFITLTTNIFENNLRYFLRMDETVGKEFTYSPNVSSNTYTLATVVIPPPASAMTLSRLFDLEDRFVHGIDIPNVAFFEVVPNNFYVTPISFYTPATTTPHIGRAVTISPVAGIINIKNGTYANATTVNKSLVFKPSGAVIIDNLTQNTPSGLLSVDGDLRIGTSLTLTDGHIANITGQFILNPTFTTLTGGSDNSYVKTPLTIDNLGKVSPFALNFPIGDPTTNTFRPLLMANVSGTGTVLRANTDLSTGGTANGTNLNFIVGTRFWNLKTISGTLTNAGTITANYGTGDAVTTANVVALSLATSGTQNGVFGSITAVQGGVGAPTGTITGATATLPADAYLRTGITCGSIAAPVLSISSPSQICVGQTGTLVINNPQIGFIYTWLGPGLLPSGIQGTNINIPSTFIGGGGSTGTYNVFLTDGIGCQSANTSTIITIIAQPVAAFAYSLPSYCKTAANPTPTTTNTGGTYSAVPTTGLSLNATTGEITLNTSTDGTYTITYTLAPAGGCSAVTATQTVAVSSPATAVISTTAILKNVNQVFWCSGDVTLTAVARGDYQYQWKKNGVNVGTLGSNTLVVSDIGDYSVDIINGCGTVTSNVIRLILSTIPDFTLSASPATTVGLGSNITLNSTLISTPTTNETYLWEGPDFVANSSIITTNASVSFDIILGGTYKLTITNGQNCVTTKTIEITTNSDFYVPNTFSPNGEGDVKNEKFVFYGSVGISEIEFKIYDRLGKLVYQASNINELLTNGWDGTYSGAAVPSGSYVWYLSGKKINGETLNYQGKNAGTLTLIR